MNDMKPDDAVTRRLREQLADARHESIRNRRELDELRSQIKAARYALEALEKGVVFAAIVGRLNTIDAWLDCLYELVDRKVDGVGVGIARLLTMTPASRDMLADNEQLRKQHDRDQELMRRMQDRLREHGIPEVRHGES